MAYSQKLQRSPPMGVQHRGLVQEALDSHADWHAARATQTTTQRMCYSKPRKLPHPKTRRTLVNVTCPSKQESQKLEIPKTRTTPASGTTAKKETGT